MKNTMYNKEKGNLGMAQVLKDVIKAKREMLNLKQSDVAEFVGVTPQTYMKWENGKNEPKAGNIKKLAEILKVSEMEICRGSLFDSDAYEQVEFMKEVASMQQFIDGVTFTSILHSYVVDKKQFIERLESEIKNRHGFNQRDIEDLPDEIFDKATLEAEIRDQNEWSKFP